MRQLWRSPGFAIAAVLTLAIGIGANLAIFAIIDTVLLRPLAYPEPDRIVQLEKVTPESSSYSASIPLFLAWSRQSDILQSIAAYSVLPVGFNLAQRDHAERVPGLRVSADFSASSASSLSWAATSHRTMIAAVQRMSSS